MQRSFGFDVMARPRCGHPSQLIALIEDPGGLYSAHPEPSRRPPSCPPPARRHLHRHWKNAFFCTSLCSFRMPILGMQDLRGTRGDSRSRGSRRSLIET
jgi:hypothetical protein